MQNFAFCHIFVALGNRINWKMTGKGHLFQNTLGKRNVQYNTK
jgi:hypothetical protein